MSNETTKKPGTVAEDAPKKPKPQTPLEKFREAHFDPKLGEFAKLRFKVLSPEATSYQLHTSQGVLVDDKDEPWELESADAHKLLQELTAARPGDAPRLVPVS